jgi:hypothetical protein
VALDYRLGKRRNLGILLDEILELDQEALAEVAGADADRIQGVEGGEDGLDPLDRDRELVGDLLGRGLEVAVVVE